MEPLKNLLVGLAVMSAACLGLAAVVLTLPWSLLAALLVLSYGVGAMFRETGW